MAPKASRATQKRSAFLEWLESQRSTVDALPFLQFMDGQIARPPRRSSSTWGWKTAGTKALVTVRVFMDAEEGAERWIEQTLNAHLVPRWCLVNYGPLLHCPQIRHRKIERRSLRSGRTV